MHFNFSSLPIQAWPLMGKIHCLHWSTLQKPSRKKNPDFYHIFALYRAEVAEVKNKNTATKKTKCFALNFSDGKCSAVSVAQFSHSYK